jgi:hypothetical protein
MKAFVVALAFALGVGSAGVARSAKKDVVVIATVTGIDEIREEFSVSSYLVTVSVTKLVAGKLTDPTLTFPIDKVGGTRLKVGGSYEIRAKWTPDGYVVGERDIRTLAAAPDAPDASDDDLLVVARVTAIKRGDLDRPWVVSTKVEKILSGQLSSRTFQFVVATPEQAGLKAGKTYTIPAHRTATGYRADELDIWRHNH